MRPDRCQYVGDELVQSLMVDGTRIVLANLVRLRCRASPFSGNNGDADVAETAGSGFASTLALATSPDQQQRLNADYEICVIAVQICVRSLQLRSCPELDARDCSSIVARRVMSLAR